MPKLFRVEKIRPRSSASLVRPPVGSLVRHIYPAVIIVSLFVSGTDSAFAAEPANGACGSSQGTYLASAPTAYLCSAGNASRVKESGSWTWTCAGRNGGSTASCRATIVTGRQYLNGIMDSPNDVSTKLLMSHPWEFTIDNSYQDPGAGSSVSGLDSNGHYPTIVDIYHIQASYSNFKKAADGGYNWMYRRTVRGLMPYARWLYAVRIDSEFNGTWEASSPFNTGVDAATWIAGFRNLANAVRKALPNVKIIWNPNVGQNNPYPYYPGDDVVDLVGFDMYCMTEHYHSSESCWKDFSGDGGGNNLQALDSFSQKHGKPIIFPEWGDTFGDGYMIQQMASWMNSHNVVAQSYWDSAAAYSSGMTSALWTLTTDQQAYIAAFNRAYTGTYWKPLIPIPASAPVP